MATYQTKQRKQLLELFEKNESRRLSIEEIIEALGEDAPGKSTVYRLVKKLEEEGELCRFTREGASKAEYQLCGVHCCSEHLHIKCTDCGLLIHLGPEAQEALTKSTGFVIDDLHSMLYGKCAACAGRSK